MCAHFKDATNKITPIATVYKQVSNQQNQLGTNRERNKRAINQIIKPISAIHQPLLSALSFTFRADKDILDCSAVQSLDALY